MFPEDDDVWRNPWPPYPRPPPLLNTPVPPLDPSLPSAKSWSNFQLDAASILESMALTGAGDGPRGKSKRWDGRVGKGAGGRKEVDVEL